MRSRLLSSRDLRRYWICGLAIVVALIGLFCWPEARQGDPIIKQLDFANSLQFALELARRVTNGTGISAAVVVPGRGLWNGTSGCSEANRPLDTDKLFDIGSVGKNFVATLIDGKGTFQTAQFFAIDGGWSLM